MARDDKDLTAMLKAEGEVVTLDTQSTYAIVEETDAEGAQGAGSRDLVRILSVTMKTGVFEGLVVGSLLGVRLGTWRVRELQQIEDGALVVARCAYVTA